MARRPEQPPKSPAKPAPGHDSGHDAALWARVAATVRPLGAKTPPPAEPRLPHVRVRAQPVEAPDISKLRAAAAPDSASLDGGWDRRVRKGEVEPERTIDLHGHTHDGAFSMLAGAIERAWRDNLRTLLVITGKARGAAQDDERPRGVIAANFPRWLATPQLRPFIAAVRPAHQRHGGRGAWYIILRRQR